MGSNSLLIGSLISDESVVNDRNDMLEQAIRLTQRYNTAQSDKLPSDANLPEIEALLLNNMYTVHIVTVRLLEEIINSSDKVNLIEEYNAFYNDIYSRAIKPLKSLLKFHSNRL